MKVYIAGPMRSKPDHNFPAFKKAATVLRNWGHEVLSPAEMDTAEGFTPAADGSIDDEQYAHFLSRDIQKIAEEGIDAVVLLPDWEESKGVAVEIAFARAIGAEVLVYPSLRPLWEAEEPGEVRVTDPNTGGQKGQKLAQLGALDPTALTKVAEVAGFGAQKYARLNYLRGFAWSLSYDAMQRHLLAFWGGEERDPESGLPHLAHAGWHVLALLAFSLHDLGTDDRWRPA